MSRAQDNPSRRRGRGATRPLKNKSPYATVTNAPSSYKEAADSKARVTKGGRFHISGNGKPAPCKAKPGQCPLGDDMPHFSTKEEAKIYLESSYRAGLAYETRRHNRQQAKRGNVSAAQMRENMRRETVETAAAEVLHHLYRRAADDPRDMMWANKTANATQKRVLLATKEFIRQGDMDMARRASDAIVVEGFTGNDNARRFSDNLYVKDIMHDSACYDVQAMDDSVKMCADHIANIASNNSMEPGTYKVGNVCADISFEDSEEPNVQEIQKWAEDNQTPIPTYNKRSVDLQKLTDHLTAEEMAGITEVFDQNVTIVDGRRDRNMVASFSTGSSVPDGMTPESSIGSNLRNLDYYMDEMNRYGTREERRNVVNDKMRVIREDSRKIARQRINEMSTTVTNPRDIDRRTHGVRDMLYPASASDAGILVTYNPDISIDKIKETYPHVDIDSVTTTTPVYRYQDVAKVVGHSKARTLFRPKVTIADKGHEQFDELSAKAKELPR